jgi:plastocyanin
MTRRSQPVSLIAQLVIVLAAAPVATAADVSATSGNTFAPSTVTVTQGEQVSWSNAGGFHNVHFDDNSFVEPPSIALPPWTVSRTFNEPGSFTYYCDAHSFVGMTGTVNVVPASSDPATDGTPAGTEPVSEQAAKTVCASKRRFTIRVRGLERVRVRSIRIDFNGRQVKVGKQVIDGRHRHTAVIDMRNLLGGTYTVAIAVTTTSGRQLRGIRTYRTCAPKLIPAKLPAL